ncbi:MAG: copper amine oxidase [Tepidiformaceae bacterium]
MKDTRIRKLMLGATGSLALTGMFIGACGGDDDTPKSTPAVQTQAATTAPGGAASPTGGAAATLATDSGAANLRALLTAQLQEHVYLAGTATGAALGGRAEEFAAAGKSLDANSVDLSKSIESVYGADAGKAFLDLWRKHIGFFVDYTTGKATNDTAKVEKARTDLDGYRADFGAFIASANPNLPKQAVADELKPHVETLFAAIDAQAAKDPAAFDKLRAAAAHMPHTAETLAGGIAKQFPDKFKGNVSGPGSALRSGLTAQLQEHVFLAGTATGAALGGRNDEFMAAAKALDANSVDLSKSIESVYGADAGKAFLDLWRKHIGFFVDYTTGKATKDDAKVEKARKDLDGYRADFGAFIASANPNLPKQAVADELTPHVATLFAAIDAQAAKDPTAFDKLRLAASHMPHTANTLAGGITKQFPQKFGS